jgi:hypothetical protein
VTNTTGLYPQLKVDTTASEAVGQAGGVLLTETIAATGIGRELSAALAPVAQAARGPRPGQGHHRPRRDARPGWGHLLGHRRGARRTRSLRAGGLRRDGLADHRRPRHGRTRRVLLTAASGDDGGVTAGDDGFGQR